MTRPDFDGEPLAVARGSGRFDVPRSEYEALVAKCERLDAERADAVRDRDRLRDALEEQAAYHEAQAEAQAAYYNRFLVALRRRLKADAKIIAVLEARP